MARQLPTPVASRPGTPINPVPTMDEDFSQFPLQSSRKALGESTEIYYVSPYYNVVEKIKLPASPPPSYIDMASNDKHRHLDIHDEQSKSDVHS
ncbi:hypothetical protein N7474_007107 [Penicillium riverlandense]|uniref:uncharacterized protein n=1 Tax=Penicillium riverlandense TaxID=1903569 RepID=UPI0025475CD7|nr:uncharacterized protein N7474_007107 [Penicillium riverlandense]KAJ5815330.1 hypothetical protein N7474_007107 [Penicillium riverlandense]